jgi:hypothetical protein
MAQIHKTSATRCHPTNPLKASRVVCAQSRNDVFASDDARGKRTPQGNVEEVSPKKNRSMTTAGTNERMPIPSQIPDGERGTIEKLPFAKIIKALLKN